MYAIFIRGRREPITCDDYIGRDISDKWKYGMGEQILEIDEVMFPSKAIYRIEPNWTEEGSVKEKEMSDNMEFYHKERIEFDKYKAKLLMIPIEQRSKDLHVAELAYHSITGNTGIPKEHYEEIYSRQLARLTEHTDELFANPICLKDLWKMEVATNTNNDIQDMKSLTRVNALNFIERVLSN